MVEVDLFEWDVLVERAKRRERVGECQQIYNNPLPNHKVMAFRDDEIPVAHNLQAPEEEPQQLEEEWGTISDDDWDIQVEGEETFSEDDWDSEAEEEQTIEDLDLLNQFNFVAMDEP